MLEGISTNSPSCGLKVLGLWITAKSLGCISEFKSLIDVRDYEKGVDGFLNIGAKIVCLTLGERGCYVANSTEESHSIDACISNRYSGYHGRR